MKIKKTHDIIIYCGLPGSGKSTHKNNFLKNFPEFISFSTDDMIEEWGVANGKNYSEAFKILTEKTDDPEAASLKNFEKKMFQDLITNIELGNSIIVDRTNMNKKSRKKFLDLVPSNYKKTAIVFNISDDELQRRLKKREEETGKHIPDFVIESMKKSYEEPTSDEFDKIIFVTE
jgi:predicted kinase